MEQVLPPVPHRFELERAGQKFDYIVTPEGWQGSIVRDKQLEHTPEIVSGAQSVADLPSFARYFTRFSDERTLVTASRTKSNVVATLDYHLDPKAPAPSKHTLTRTYKRDRRFAAWKDRSGKPLTQVALVEFLEDRIADVITPSQSELMQSIVQFKAHRTATCTSAIHLPSGDIQAQYVQDTRNAAGNAVLPERITLQLPILEFEREYTIDARLRFRLNEGALTFSFDLVNIEDAEDFAFKTAVEDLSREINAVVLLTD